MDNRIGEMQVFCRVAETGGFSQAARALGMPPSTVSKLVARIEARLGVRLVERSTRRLALTAEGALYHERALALLGDLDGMERELAQGAAAAGGRVRVNASVAFGALGLEPLLPGFWRAWPNIVVDLSLSDGIVDLFLDRTDVAFRVGPLPDSGMTARRIGVARRKIVAAPAYVARRGAPARAEDLAQHDCLGFNFRRAAPVWPLREGGRLIERAAPGPLLADNGETVRRMALAGAGIARLGDYHVRADLAAGRLVELLAGVVEPDEEPIHAVYLGGPRQPQRIRAFLDFVVPPLQRFLAGEG